MTLEEYLAENPSIPGSGVCVWQDCGKPCVATLLQNTETLEYGVTYLCDEHSIETLQRFQRFLDDQQ